MNKYFVVMVAACMVPLQANASWYAGLNFGINTVAVKKDLMYPLGEPQPITTSSFNNTYTNFHGQFLAGYDFNMAQKINAAIEANVDVFTGRAKQTINNWFLTNNVYAQEQLEYGGALFFYPPIN